MKIICLPVFALLICCACNSKKAPNAENVSDSTSGVSHVSFGKMNDRDSVQLYTLKNKNGMSITVINYGAIITSITVPDKNGVFEDVVLGFDSLKQYLKSSPYFGAIVGRYGNRIANGRFELDGVKYQLAVNDGKNHLHGGIKGFDKVFWKIAPNGERKSSLKLTYVSKDKEEGYPGDLTVNVIYTLTDENALEIEYAFHSDRATIANVTQHSYFNLSGNVKRDILRHQLQLNADRYLPVDQTLIPTGELRKVEGTPFDFRSLKTIGDRIDNHDEQLKFGIGYDHCWVFTDTSRDVKPVATLYDPDSGRKMEVLTSQPAVQFYSGNFLDGTLTGKNGVVYQHRYGLCLETQHFPDSPNHPEFPSVIVEPGKVYKSKTVYRFSAKH